MLIDDIILAGKTEQDLEEVKTALSTKFNIKDLGELNYFLRIKVDQKTQDSIWIGQPSHTKNLLKTLGMQDCKHASEQHLQAHQSNRQGCVCEPEGVSVCDRKFAVSLCLYTAGHFICCEQFGQIHIKPHEGALVSSETITSLPERNPELWNLLHYGWLKYLWLY